MENKEIKVKIESVDPTGVVVKDCTTKIILYSEENAVIDRLYLTVGECVYKIDNKGFIIERVVPKEDVENSQDKFVLKHFLSSLRKVYPRYDITIDEGKVLVDGKVIKRAFFKPSFKDYDLLNKHIDFIINIIGEDIKKGRFIGLTK